MEGMQMVARKIGSHRLPDGREITLYNLGPVDFSAAQEAALAYYKRQMIKTVTENVDLLPQDMRMQAIKDAYGEAQRITLAELPDQPIRVPDLAEDQETVLKDEHGNVKTHMKDVDYVSWWMSETVEGMIHCLWLSARKDQAQQQWTKDDIMRLFEESVSADLLSLEIDSAAQTVGRLSQSELAKNSSNAQEKESLSERERRMRKREERIKKRKDRSTGR